jgi:quinol-cytochrome oxidoreductase complex cytochrome b subunit/coenzyme F420-reducing hydrogenase delta subunit
MQPILTANDHSMPAFANGPAARAFRALDRLLDRPFGAAANPLRQLGALGYHAFWIIAASGAYLYVFFDTSLDGAYRSVAALHDEQPWAGGLARSVHRYAADAFVTLMLLHVAREWAYGRYRGFRWFSWLSGVPLPWLAAATGVTGYWLVWDERALFVAVATAEWFGAVPGVGADMVRNFVADAAMADRFFSLMAFLHIGLPLLVLLGMWVHVQRITRPHTRPAAVTGWGLAAALVLLAIAHPAVSLGPAEAARAPAEVPLDWFFLAGYPLVYEVSPALLWALAAAGTLLVAALPWTGRAQRPRPARVDLANCNGCGRCFADCPYAAVVMRPRTDGRPHAWQAQVLDDLCASCGICAGACPSSAPFRRAAGLPTGIDLPHRTIGDVRARLDDGLSRMRGAARVVVFGCECAADVRALAGPDVMVVTLPCTGMLPPTFVDYALRVGADGVLVTGCPPHDCEFRSGTHWTAERLAGQREPHLRASAPRERLAVAWAAREDLAIVGRALASFRAALGGLLPRGAVATTRHDRGAEADRG